MKRKQANALQFVQLHYWVMRSAAWLDLTPNDRCVYLALKMKYNGQNNGSIAFGAREAGAAIGASHSTGNRSLQSLLEHGFVLITEDSNFNRKVKAARQYLLTEARDDRPGHSPLPLKTFMRWRSEIQNTVSPVNKTVSPMTLRVINGGQNNV